MNEENKNVIWVVPSRHSSQKNLKVEDTQEFKARKLGADFKDGSFFIPDNIPEENQRRLARTFQTATAKKMHDRALDDIAQENNKPVPPRKWPEPPDVNLPSPFFMQVNARLHRYDWNHEQNPSAEKRAEGTRDQTAIRYLMQNLDKNDRIYMVKAHAPEEKNGAVGFDGKNRTVADRENFDAVHSAIKADSEVALLGTYKMLSRNFRKTKNDEPAMETMQRTYSMIGAAIQTDMIKKDPKPHEVEPITNLMAKVGNNLQMIGSTHKDEDFRETAKLTAQHMIALRENYRKFEQAKQHDLSLGKHKSSESVL